MALLGIVASACSGSPDGGSPDAGFPDDAPLAGDWRAVLTSPGGELPFTLAITDDGGVLSAAVRNGAEEAPVSSVERDGSQVAFHFAWYDSEIVADLVDGGERLRGRWRRTSPGGTDTVMPFVAERGDDRRFLPIVDSAAVDSAAVDSAAVDSAAGSDAPASIAGHWAVEFRDEDGAEPARGEFRQDGRQVTGTFLTPTGDYRFLAGSYEGGRLRLSTFDGAHAFLFDATARADGTLEGDFWSRDSYHATWTARPIAEDEEVLPDPWEQVGLTNDEGRFGFSFPDLEGRTVSLDDPRFDGKVVIVNVFGSWCPNCNDEAPLLADWHRRYRDRGLELVGLAYEFSGDPERDRTMVHRFGERHGIEYPLLLAGISDKQAAGATLPDLTAVLSYPTSIFIGRDGKVRKIHSGYSGPGTGEHHERLVAEHEALIEELLAETEPS